jgi:hypothetical protein
LTRPCRRLKSLDSVVGGHYVVQLPELEILVRNAFGAEVKADLRSDVGYCIN